LHLLTSLICTFLDRWLHRSIYKYLDTGLPSLSLANGDPLKLTSPAQHASRWCMRGSQTCRLLCLCCQLAGCQDDAILRGTGVYTRKFRNEITHAMHAGQERWVWRARRLAVSTAPVVDCKLHLFRTQDMSLKWNITTTGSWILQFSWSTTINKN